MDDKLSTLKDTSFLNDLHMDSTMQQHVMEKLHTQPAIKRKTSHFSLRKWIPYLALVACLAILIPIGFNYLTGNSSAGNPALLPVEKKASQMMGQNVVIPYYKDYPLLGVEVDTELYQNKSIQMGYGTAKGTKYDKSLLDNLKEHQQRDFIYGLYKGTSVITIDYRKGHVELGDQGVKTKNINGKKISYGILKRPNAQYLFAQVNNDDGSYGFQFTLSGALTEDQAFKMIGDLINQLK